MCVSVRVCAAALRALMRTILLIIILGTSTAVEIDCLARVKGQLPRLDDDGDGSLAKSEVGPGLMRAAQSGREVHDASCMQLLLDEWENLDRSSNGLIGPEELVLSRHTDQTRRQMTLFVDDAHVEL